jgi:hypothetical protein
MAMLPNQNSTPSEINFLVPSPAGDRNFFRSMEGFLRLSGANTGGFSMSQ